MNQQIRRLGSDVENITEPCLSKTKLILEHAHESARALLKAFDRIRRTRGGRHGQTTDEEQDLIRSMLVLSAAGLDSMVKQIIRDSLVNLAERDLKVYQGIETFVTKRIKNDEENITPTNAAKFLAGILVSSTPREKIFEQYIDYLTGGSLQSADELTKAIYALGLAPNDCAVDPAQCKIIFNIRNNIIHELDINFTTPRRRRHPRRRGDMIDHANCLLEIAEKILVNISQKIANEQ